MYGNEAGARELLARAGEAAGVADVIRAHLSRLGSRDYCGLLAFLQRNPANSDLLGGLRQRIGNYPGVTVERHVGTLKTDDQVIELAPEAGMESPDDAPNLDLPPGSYDVTTEVGSSSVTDEVTVGPDESWGLLLDEQGAFPMQIY